jgi:hypothetical protein
MNAARTIVGSTLLMLAGSGSGLVSSGQAQETARPGPSQVNPRPSIDLTVTDVLNRTVTDAPKREDVLNPPPARVNKLPESVRITVTAGDPRCYPGEDLGIAPDLARGRSTRPGRR